MTPLETPLTLFTLEKAPDEWGTHLQWNSPCPSPPTLCVPGEGYRVERWARSLSGMSLPPPSSPRAGPAQLCVPWYSGLSNFSPFLSGNPSWFGDCLSIIYGNFSWGKWKRRSTTHNVPSIQYTYYSACSQHTFLLAPKFLLSGLLPVTPILFSKIQPNLPWCPE